ncbi:hypothetical protein D9M72_274800 [compost metagenome]
MAIHPDIGTDGHALAHHAPHGEAAFVAGRLDVLDGDTRGLHRGHHAAQASGGQRFMAVRRARVGGRHAGPRQGHRRHFIEADIGGRQRNAGQRIEPVVGIERPARATQ